jgi:hypothetical protein
MMEIEDDEMYALKDEPGMKYLTLFHCPKCDKSMIKTDIWTTRTVINWLPENENPKAIWEKVNRNP